MDPELSTSVDAATNIISSGRWSAVMTKVGRLAANASVDDGRHAGLLKSFGSHVFSEFALLKSAHAEDQEGDPRLLAWRARNLLELSVWSIYCSKSRANAWRFYEDAGRDLMDVFSAFERVGLATNQQPDFFDAFVGAKHDLSKRAASHGIESLEGQYKKVHQASKECEIEDLFNFNYKLLSKFAHPTAMIVLASADGESNTLQRDYFFNQGCLFFTKAFKFLEVWLERELGGTPRAL